MNNVNMGGMNAMGGPIGGGGGGMPTMSNGAAPGIRQPMPGNDNRSQLNTYIYEYFLKNEMYDCARSLLRSEQPMSLVKDSPGRRREGEGGEDGGDPDSKDDIDVKRPEDLPAPNLPRDTPESCFLYEWWCLFWDMFNATRGKAEGRNVLQYVSHTQNASRARQEAQHKMLQDLRGNNMMPQYNNMMMNKNPINGGNQDLRQRMISRQMPQNLQMVQNKQQQMQRDPSNQDGQPRTQSPGSAENAPSPSKRPRLDGTNFNPQPMPNGRTQAQGMAQQVGDAGPNNFQNMPGGNTTAQARLAGYQANLAQQQQSQMPGAKGPMPNPGQQGQGSPMMGGAVEGPGIAIYYNPVENNRAQMAGQPGAPGGNHALQDYQMQLMLLEQQNKKRLMMARQEQDNMSGPRTGENPGGPGGGQMPNGQPYQGTSPQGQRPGNSPGAGDQMKRGNPQLPGGMPSPLPDAQNRGSPGGGINYNMPGGALDPNMNQPYKTFMDPNMGNVGMQNGMRPPSSHPGQGFPAQNMTQQQVVMARGMAQQQQAAQAAQQGGWQGPNGQMGQAPQGTPQQQNMGTPQQRAMPPPSAPQTGPAINGRTPSSPQQGAAPPTPQQGNKAITKGKKADPKDTKAKRATKKGSAPNLNAGATPSADTDAAGATPTPQTPITPNHTFKANGAVQPPANGQPAAQITNVPQTNEMYPNNFDVTNFNPYDPGPMGFNENHAPGTDVLTDFDFDSFLHQDVEVGEPFNFDTSGLDFGESIGAE